VVQFGNWMPDVPVTVAVLHPTALASIEPDARHALVSDLQRRTPPGGMHVILPWSGDEPNKVIPIGTDTLLSLYEEWQIDRRPRGRRGGFAASKNPRQSDTQANVSE